MNKIVYVMGIGVININTGRTMYDWSIYDSSLAENASVYLTDENSLLYCQTGTFEIGDVVDLFGNDSRRSLKRGVTIIDSSVTIKENVLKMLKQHNFDYYPIRPFTKRPSGNRKLKTSYSVK